MSDKLVFATRKGLFFFARTKKGWQLDGDALLGSPMTFVIKDRRDDTLYGAANLGHFGPKLYRSNDGGKAWDEITMPAFEKEEEKSVHQIWSLAMADPAKPGTLWAGVIPCALFRSDDGGQSWSLNRTLWERPEREKWFGGGYDDAGIHSICVDPRDADRVAVAISAGGVWVSEDGGRDWSMKTKGMRAEYMPPDMQDDGSYQDPHLMVQSPSAPERYWVQHHNGIFRSTDNLESWTELTPETCPAFGFAVAVHPADPETAWFVPAVKDEYRYPKDGRFVVSRTRDGGQTFEAIDNGLPDVPSYDLVYRHGLVVDDTGARLAMGSTTGGAWVSEDDGDSWSVLPARLPPVYAVAFV